MASTEDCLNTILREAHENQPAGVTDEVEFSIVGYAERNGELKYDHKYRLSMDKYSQILKGLIAASGAPEPEPEQMLTIKPGNSEARIRMTDRGLIRGFCMSSDNSVDHEHSSVSIEKKTKTTHDCIDYGVRINYANEEELQGEERTTAAKAVEKNKTEKTYRYAQRYSIVHPTKLGATGTCELRVDFTAVKQGKGTYFRGAYLIGPTGRVPDKYEIEIELTNCTKGDLEHEPTRVAIKSYLQPILLALNGGIVVQPQPVLLKAMQDYSNLCHRLWPNIPDNPISDLSQGTRKDLDHLFITPNINTMQCRKHVKSGMMLPEEGQPPTYMFTDKADGRRAILFTDAEGTVFLILKDPVPENPNAQVKKLSFRAVPNIYATGAKLTKVVDKEVVPWNDLILDGELLELNDRYHFLTFDVLSANIEVRGTEFVTDCTASLPFAAKKGNNRWDIIKKISYDEGNFSVKCKEFLEYNVGKLDNLFQKFIDSSALSVTPSTANIHKMEYTSNGLTYELDGLVFQPKDVQYPKPNTKKRTWMEVIKWKPLRFLTVDLKLTEPRKGMKQSTGRDLGIEVPTEEAGDEQYQIFNAASMDRRRLITSDYNVYAPIVRGAPRTEADEPIRSGDIVECRLTRRLYWEPVRVRYDKTHPNGSAAYESTLDLVVNPVSLKNLAERGGGLGSSLPLCDINRYLSNSNLIQYGTSVKLTDPSTGEVDDNVYILDLASGNAKSGGAWMITKIRTGDKFKKLVCIDKDDNDNFNAATIFMGKLTNNQTGDKIFRRQDYAFHWGDMTQPLHKKGDDRDFKPAGLSGTTRTEDLLMPRRFGLVACVYAIHYAFGSEESFRTLLANVSRNLALGGHFVGSYLNKGKVLEIQSAPTSKTTVQEEGSETTITAQESGKVIWGVKYSSNDSVFGRPIVVTLSNRPPPGYNVGKEYMVDLEDPTIKKLCEEYGLKLVKHDQFNYRDAQKRRRDLAELDLTDADKNFIGLHYNFAFYKFKQFKDPEQLFSEKPPFDVAREISLRTKAKAKVPAARTPPTGRKRAAPARRRNTDRQ